MSNSDVKTVIAQDLTKDSAKTGTDSIIKKSEKVERQQSLDNWYYLIISYLSSSKFVFNEIKSKGLDENNREFIIPALYNLKHTIEIILKYLYLSNQIEYDWGHDIEILIKELAKNKQMKKRGRKLVEGTDEYTAFQNIITLSSKYATLEFLTPKFGSFLINDGKNDLFRYPNGQAFIKRLDYSLFVSNITLADISNILEDIILLEKGVLVLKKYFISENIED